jgi:prolyl oligopeptidase
VRDTYFGTEVVDPYRWMETPDSAELRTYLDAQNAYTRAQFARIAPARDVLYRRMLELNSATDSIRFVQQVGKHYYYLATPANADTARVMRRTLRGGEDEVILEAAQVQRTGARASIDFFSAAPNDRHVAVAVSHGGAEDWVLRIYDARTRRLLDDALTDLSGPFPHWEADGRAFYYTRLRPLPPGAGEEQRYDFVRVYRHVLGTRQDADTQIFGAGVVPSITVPERSVFPDVIASSDGRWLIASVVLGTDYGKPALWVRRTREHNDAWRAIASHEDGLSAMAVHDNTLYAIRQRDDGNGEVIALDLRKPELAKARVVVPAGDVVLSADSGYLEVARDALYVAGLRDGAADIRRLPWRGGALETLTLPAAATLSDFSADPHRDGLNYAVESPVLSPRLYAYNPGTRSARDTGLRPAHPADFSAVTVQRVEVDSTNGARVPLTIVMPKAAAHGAPRPTLMAAYGAYGAIAPVGFVPANLAWYERGGMYVFVHARGGGEKGAAWRDAARSTRKQATIDDVLAAARWLMAQGYTDAAHLAVAGKSAGGIAAGGALTQGPELFRAALLRVAVVDMLRIEHSAGGEANTREYGSTRNEDEFRVLHAISPYHRVRDGVAYPAVLLETGINDPRVPSWQLAKMTARLQAATTTDRPILLRVDYDAGHGLGNSKTQAAALLADEYAFLLWQFGEAAFQPKAGEP